jgi:hypothetical protein
MVLMGARRVVVRSLVLCAVGLCSVWCGSASAKILHPYLSSFGAFGATVEGVAVDQSSGDVYVYDSSAGAIDKFDASGAPVEFTASKTSQITGVPGSGNAEGELAVDNSAGPAKGDIYVSHGGTTNVLIYSEAGSQIGELTQEAGVPWGEACGVGVDQAGAVYVGIYAGEVNKYVPKANPVTNADYSSSIGGASNPCNLAVDSAGDVFAATWSEGPVERYEASQFGLLSATGSVVDATGSSLAVDGKSDEVFVDEHNQISQFGPKGEPFEEPVMTFAGSGEGAIGGSYGIAVDETNGNVYASDGKGKISVFGPATNLPTVLTGSASGVTHTEASLTGSVNPEGVTVTACRFEYGTTTAYSQTLPCPTSPGAGNQAVDETVVPMGLQAGTEYHYRLAVSTAAGESTGADRTFKTAILWPETSTGLPDGRLYEQVTPPFKNGNFFDALHGITFGLASEDGNAVLYPMSGPVGSASSGIVTEFASKRTPAAGWQTVSTTPRSTGEVNPFSGPITMVPSSDFTRFLFISTAPFVAAEPDTGHGSGVNLFLSEDAFSEPEWLGRPETENAIPTLGSVGTGEYIVAGQSPSLDTVYFTYAGTLVPDDASRAQYVALAKASRGDDPWGFYEWSDGKLVSAGALPDGSFNPFGAVPAAIAGQEIFARGFQATQAETIDNQISSDGSRAYFVSPDPVASTVSGGGFCQTEPPCSSEAPQLYLREEGPDGGKVSVLVSASKLPGHEGEAAPDGVISMPTAPRDSSVNGGGTDIYASPDGSRAFFASRDQLTPAAPSGSEVKIYEYDVNDGSLSYLPGVTAPIVTVSDDGSEMLFEGTRGTQSQLELWRSGPSGGSVGTVAELVAGSPPNVNQAHMSEDGSIVVFRTDAAIPGGFNNGAGFNEIYRYDVNAHELSCVSCPPAGVAPSGDARMSYNNNEGGVKLNGANSVPETTIEARGISADGSRVFFDSPDALVPQDTNGTRDVYEWQHGTVYLISSGASTEESLYLDNGKNGQDVFFATSSGLVSSDTDEAYDVYDARIPRPGDNPPPSQVPCKGSVCQGPPSIPQLWGSPASETFTGAGNVTSQAEAVPKDKSKRKATKKKGKKKRSKSRKKPRAKKKQKAKRSITGRRASRRAMHGNGRGN